ncbi:MAG: glycoside hydrolase family 43 protein, partial [Lachnospiraceae bacterium]|nr:glycoside hydrolase family 43 protein [Lachnospiraceae bacterium]
LLDPKARERYLVHFSRRASKDRNPENGVRFPNSRRYMLGRETALQKMCWTEDDWLVLEGGGNTPKEEVEGPEIPGGTEGGAKAAVQDGTEQPKEPGRAVKSCRLGRDDFNGQTLDLDYQSLRIPMDGHYLSLTARPGWLRMYGRSGLSSKFSQTLIARRMTRYHMMACACMEFEPDLFKQMAGLIFLYDTDNYLYLHVSRDEDIGKCITLLKAENKKYEYLTEYLPLGENQEILLKLEIEENYVQFYYGYDEKEMKKAGPQINAGFLSDEACDEGWFTGAMIGICCQDLTGFGKYADFDYFEVTEK